MIGVYIDGFNFYHMLDKVQKTNSAFYQYLDFKKLSILLAEKHLKVSNPDLFVKFFTALPTHLIAHNPDKGRRHEEFVEIQKDLGVEVIEGKFKKKTIYCRELLPRENLSLFKGRYSARRKRN